MVTSTRLIVTFLLTMPVLFILKNKTNINHLGIAFSFWYVVLYAWCSIASSSSMRTSHRTITVSAVTTALWLTPKKWLVTHTEEVTCDSHRRSDLWLTPKKWLSCALVFRNINNSRVVSCWYLACLNSPPPSKFRRI